MSWVVIHEQADQEYGQHKTKKAATAAAKEMQDAHEKADALHDGQAITFRVEKRADQEPAEEPVKDQ
jgi:hypothetical protein